MPSWHHAIKYLLYPCAAEPLYDFLKAKQSGFLVSDIKWNFTKFLVSSAHSMHVADAHFLAALCNHVATIQIWHLIKVRVGQVDREGNVVKRYGSSTTPLQIEEDIKKLL